MALVKKIKERKAKQPILCHRFIRKFHLCLLFFNLWWLHKRNTREVVLCRFLKLDLRIYNLFCFLEFQWAYCGEAQRATKEPTWNEAEARGHTNSPGGTQLTSEVSPPSSHMSSANTMWSTEKLNSLKLSYRFVDASTNSWPHCNR